MYNLLLHMRAHTQISQMNNINKGFRPRASSTKCTRGPVRRPLGPQGVRDDLNYVTNNSTSEMSRLVCTNAQTRACYDIFCRPPDANMKPSQGTVVSHHFVRPPGGRCSRQSSALSFWLVERYHSCSDLCWLAYLTAAFNLFAKSSLPSRLTGMVSSRRSFKMAQAFSIALKSCELLGK